MDISFLNPGFLLLLLAIPALWFFPRRVGDVTQAILRSLLFACVVLGLARPVLLTADRALFQVLILDRSASISADRQIQGVRLAAKWAEQLDDKDKATVIIIGDGTGDARAQGNDELAQVLAAAGRVLYLGQVGSVTSSSCLSAALAAAHRQIPHDSPGVVTLVSDGLSTDRRWGPAVQTFVERGIAVNTADLGRDEDDVYPAGMKTEPVVRLGQTTRIAVPVVGKASDLQVRLFDSRGVLLATSSKLSSAGWVEVPLEFEPRSEGFMAVRAEVTAASADSNTANNTFNKVLAVQPPVKLLYLGERMRGGAARLGELLGNGFDIKDGSGLNLAEGSPDLNGYDLAMVDDRTAALMPDSFQQQLSHSIRREGLGLVFSGGKDSFGTGGYDGTAIAGLLPVEFTQHTEKRDPSTALALIVDTSGSMRGTRIELAKQVARLAVRRLKAHDRVGIVEFYGNKHWALPMQSAANKISIDRAIGRMQADEGTVLYPAIREAFYGLKNVATRYKHILIITDAGVEDSDYKKLIRRIAKEHVNVSTVLVGDSSHNGILSEMANWGRGRFYTATDRYALPEMILKQPSTMKLPAYKTGSFAVRSRGGEGWWDRIDRGAIPALTGYVETKDRPGAEVLIEVDANAHPVLSSWHYGLGRVTAFMTEPVGEGTDGWQNWRDYGRLLARVANRTADDSRAFWYEIKRDDDRVTVTAYRDAANGLYPQAAMLDEQGQERAALNFKRMAPNHFTAELRLDPSKEIRIAAGARDSRGDILPRAKTRLVSGAAEDIAPELQVNTTAALDLRALAEATAGEVLDVTQPQTAVFAHPNEEARSALTLFKLWPYALLLALLLYLTELTYRRWPRS